MRRLLPATAVLLLLLAGCGDDGGDGGGSGGSDGDPVALDDIDPCGALTADTVELLVGQPATLEESEAALPTCSFAGEGDDVGSVVQVLALPMGGPVGFADFDEVLESQRLGKAELEVDDVEIPGTEQAALVDDDAYGLASTTLLAVADGVAYTVYPSGVTRDDEVRVATGALVAVLGGDLPDGAAIEPATTDVCSLMTEDAVAEVVGTEVTATPSSAAGSPSCGWAGEGTSVLATDIGSTSRIEGLAGLGGDGDGSTTTPIEVDGDAEAYLRETEAGANAYLAVGHRAYALDASLPDAADEAEALRQVVALLVAGSA